MFKRIVILSILGYAVANADSSANRFLNPSFEDSRAPWISLANPDKPYWHDFSVAPDPKDPSRQCARLELSSESAHEKAGIWGVVQEIKESVKIPRFLRGRYFVENWQRGTAKQYIQVVLTVWPTEIRNLTRAETTPETIPFQLAFVLGGITEAPFKIGNRNFTFHGPAEPQMGEWIDFEFDLHVALKNYMGKLPEKFTAFQSFFEIRFDGRTETEKSARATVYFDDLYLGDEGARPSGAATVGSLTGAR